MQNSKLYFMNNGTFDLRGMLTMGLSAKQDDSAIGFFGTGFKYAVAIILRNQGTIKITTKGEDGFIYTYDFFVKQEDFRGKQVDFIYIRCETTGDVINSNFTTRMGINWQGWMAFRELYCNCIDERGEISTELKNGFDTVIEVNCLPIIEAFNDKDNYILPSNLTPIASSPEIDIYENLSTYIYYKGIAVLKADNLAFSYNIKTHIELTEDRTVKEQWYIWNYIKTNAQRCENEKYIETILQADCKERDLSFNADYFVGNKFAEVSERLSKSEKGIPESVRLLLKKKTIKDRNFPEFALNQVQQMSFDKAVSFLAMIDIPISQFPIKFVNGLGDNVMGRALDGTIYISEIPFQMGTKQIASTLMEEWVHLKLGCSDFDRKMQNWLFDKILSLGETIVSEPV